MNREKKRMALVGALFAVLFAVFIGVFMLFPGETSDIPGDVGTQQHTHTLSTWITEKEATCIQSGVKYQECTVCKERITSQIVEKKGHIESEDWTVISEPTCTRPGEKSKSCIVCNEFINIVSSGPAEHDYGEWTTGLEPTCQNSGTKYRFCKICAYSHYDRIEELPHTYGKWTVNSEPDCFNEGEKISVCTLCKVDKVTEKISALGHKYKGNVCEVCKKTVSSEGLEFALNADGKSYTMVGFGTCSDSEIIIDLYNDLPVTAVKIINKFIEVEARSIILGNSVTSIGDNSFSQLKKLEKITFTGKTSDIGAFAFNNCLALKEVYIADIASWCETDFGNEYANPMYCAKDVYINGEPLNVLEIPEGIAVIKKYAFYGAEKLSELKLPSTLRAIEKYSFKDCTALLSLSFGKAVTELGIYAFENCTALTDLKLGDGLNIIGAGCFKKCTGIIDLTLPDSVTDVGERVFEGCANLKSVHLSDSLKAVSKYMFYNCKALESVDIPISVKSISDHAFYGCTSLEAVKIGSGVNEIGGYAFMKCGKLRSINIPEGVTYLTSYVFAECNSLETIIIPRSLNTLHNYAFTECPSLKILYFCGNSSEWGKVFIGHYNEAFANAKVYYYSATKPSSDGDYWYYDPILW